MLSTRMCVRVYFVTFGFHKYTLKIYKFHVTSISIPVWQIEVSNDKVDTNINSIGEIGLICKCQGMCYICWWTSMSRFIFPLLLLNDAIIFTTVVLYIEQMQIVFLSNWINKWNVLRYVSSAFILIFNAWFYRDWYQ